jgi:diguanylate cyclase (GGDEF)-like protein
VDETPVESDPALSRGARDRCLLTVTIGPEFAGVHRLVGSELVIGRGDDVDVHVTDAFVSQRHARFIRGKDGGVQVEDLGSRNGTYVGTTRVTEPRRLRDGDYVRLSREVLVRCGFHDELSEKAVLALYESSTTDSLTGAHNRRFFESRLEAEVSFAGRHATPLALLLFDVDRFKRVNDTHGHAVGDGVLRVLAESVQRVLRPEDLFARYAGDEFVVLARATTLRNGEILAERLRRTIEELPLDGVRPGLSVSSSIGVAARTATSQCSAPLLVALADRAMYRAKAAGHNRVVAISVP